MWERVKTAIFIVSSFFQINNVDLTDARHDQAVSLLTGLDRKIHLVVYREKVVSADEADKTPPKGEKVVNFSAQPRVIWNKTVSETIPSETITFSQSAPIHQEQITVEVGQNISKIQPSPSSPESPLPPPLPSAPAPVISPAIPPSYTYPSQASPPTQIINPSASPSLSPRTLSSDWNSPPAAIQPPKFQYPGRAGSRSSTVERSKDRKDTSPVSVATSSSPVTNVSSVQNSVTSNSDFSTSFNHSSDRQIDSGHLVMTVEKQTITLPSKTSEPVANHVNSNHSDEMTPVLEKYPIEDCVIVKAGGPLGLSIVGGSDHSSQPFGQDEPGIFVSKVKEI